MRSDAEFRARHNFDGLPIELSTDTLHLFLSARLVRIIILLIGEGFLENICLNRHGRLPWFGDLHVGALRELEGPS